MRAIRHKSRHFWMLAPAAALTASLVVTPSSAQEAGGGGGGNGGGGDLLFADDKDADGIPDAFDQFPCKSAANSVVSVPAAGVYSLLMFEDLWPFQGDFDFNDVVLNYNVQLYTTSSNQVAKVRATFFVRAHGATNNSGIGWRLPVGLSGATVRRTIGNGTPVVLTPVAGEDELTVRVVDNVRAQVFNNAQGLINTVEGNPTRAGFPVTVDVEFATPVTISSADAPFDVFIFKSEKFGHQVHMPQFGGTDTVDSALFGTGNDTSNALRKYVDGNGVPFALHVPADTVHPIENTRIESVFPRILDFGASGGASFPNFFANELRGAGAFSGVVVTPAVPEDRAYTDNSCVTGDTSGADEDGDGLSNADEVTLGTNPTVADSDGDGLPDADEVNLYTTNPLNTDSDGDGVSDILEINTHATNPKSTDSDGDGLSDGAEINVHGCNPNVADSDGDGLNDSVEVNIHGTNPKNADSDGDGLTDAAEINTHGTNPKNADSDGDGTPDAQDILGLGDNDHDGLTDGQEASLGTNPNVADTDGDGLNDGNEVNVRTTNPKVADRKSVV